MRSIATTSTTLALCLFGGNGGAAALSLAPDLPTLRGVVFDMDDTLVRANLDISEMYRRIFGRSPSKDDDILRDIRALPGPEEIARAHTIIDEMEEDSRQNMELMPGCVEVLSWLSAHKIPTALVTRNTRQTTDLFCQKLMREQQQLQQQQQQQHIQVDLSFRRIVTRDDPIPPKPDPTALNTIMTECFGVVVGSDGDDHRSGVLMVGDSVSNDVAFGKNAGASTALLLQGPNAADEGDNGGADICLESLIELPKRLWKKFAIEDPLETAPASATPSPSSDFHRAIAAGDLPAVRQSLERLLREGTSTPTTLETTALIEAAREGHTHVVEFLLEAAGSNETPLLVHPNRAHPPTREYPLHAAAHHEHASTVACLLEKGGANPWVLDRQGRTPRDVTECGRCRSLLTDAMTLPDTIAIR